MSAEGLSGVLLKTDQMRAIQNENKYKSNQASLK